MVNCKKTKTNTSMHTFNFMLLGTVIWVKTIHLWQGRYVFELVIFHLLFKSFMKWAVRSVWWSGRWITPMASPKIIFDSLLLHHIYRYIHFTFWYLHLLREKNCQMKMMNFFSLRSFLVFPCDSKLNRVIWVQKFLIVIQTFRQTNFHIDNANQTIKSLVMSSQLSVKVKLFFCSDADQLVFRFFVVGMIEKESKILLGIVVRT